MRALDSEEPRWLGGLAALGLVLALASSCGHEREPGRARVRLTDLAGELHAQASSPAFQVLREDFEGAPEGGHARDWRPADWRPADWHVVTDMLAPLAGDPALLRTTPGREGARGFVTLAGPRGALYRIVPVEPDTPYRFEGELRARAFLPAVAGARFLLAELAQHGTPAEVFGPGRDPILVQYPLADAAGVEGWQTRTTSFRTNAATRALLVMCQLWLPNPAKQQPDLAHGQADFEHLTLARISEHELWEFEAARAVATAYRGDVLPPPEDARARRRVDAMLGAEQRPALLCLPGETLEFTLDVPRDEPVLEAGVAPWPAAFRALAEPAQLWIGLDERELWRGPLPNGASLAGITWQEISLDLSAYAGEQVTLELGCEGALPGVFGAPVVRARAAPSAGWNVLLVSIDTLRSDHVGAYGATSGVTPRLDRLARESILFEDMTANAPYTLPAHASLFSGQFPSVHRVEDEGLPFAPSRSPVLARLLAERGYRTQAFTAAGFLTPDFGFHAGFDGFSIRDPLRYASSKFFRDFAANYPAQGPAPAEPGSARVRRWRPPRLRPGATRPATEPGSTRVRRWIRAHKDEPFFLFVHTYEVHDYDPPPGYLDCASTGCSSQLTDFGPLTLKDKNRAPFPGTDEDRAHLGHLYDAALRHVDRALGSLLDELERSGIAERTLVVVTSDHGEEQFERGFLQHGKSLHREVLAIPLVVRVPGLAPARVAAPAQQVDVTPTILAALGLPRDARMQGRDLLAKNVALLPIWSEVNDVRARQASLRDGAWKIVYGPQDAQVRFKSEREWSLYDLVHDPEEGEDLSASAGEELARLRRLLESFQQHLSDLSARLGPPPSGAVDEAAQQMLRGLGYGGGSGPEGASR